MPDDTIFMPCLRVGTSSHSLIASILIQEWASPDLEACEDHLAYLKKVQPLEKELQWLGQSAFNVGMEGCPQLYRGLADIEVGHTPCS